MYIWRAAWRAQKNNAKNRGIKFKFTYEQWVQWWEDELGQDWFQKRGCRRGQFVMARHLDRGDYEPGNVKCVLQNSNHVEANLRKKTNGGASRLTADEVKSIYLERELCAIVAKKHGVSKGVVERIKRGETYSDITSGLGLSGRVLHWSMSPRRMRLDELKRRLGREDIWIRRL